MTKKVQHELVYFRGVRDCDVVIGAVDGPEGEVLRADEALDVVCVGERDDRIGRALAEALASGHRAIGS